MYSSKNLLVTKTFISAMIAAAVTFLVPIVDNWASSGKLDRTSLANFLKFFGSTIGAALIRYGEDTYTEPWLPGRNKDAPLKPNS